MNRKSKVIASNWNSEQVEKLKELGFEKTVFAGGPDYKLEPGINYAEKFVWFAGCRWIMQLSSGKYISFHPQSLIILGVMEMQDFTKSIDDFEKDLSKTLKELRKVGLIN